MKPPSPVIAPLIEWQARRIDDPIARLRFLRTAAARTSMPLPVPRRWKYVLWAIAVPFAVLALNYAPGRTPATVRTPVVQAGSRTLKPSSPPVSNVWPVEQKREFEIYSNGLRVEKEFVTGNHPRREYPMFRPDGEGEVTGWSKQPAGIVYHSTESDQAPFEPAQTRTLKRLGRNLLEYVRTNRSYHYVIDRFGRVFRVVEETDAANHAGRSVWSDAKGTYVYLNQSFLGVAIESQSDTDPSLSIAQTHSLRVLTEMLRSKYSIQAPNCVTHAQVSINPSNHRIGYHTDWATGFPFSQIGLPDNYRLPLASVSTFGFEYDDTFLNAAGDQRWPGLLASLDEVSERSKAAGVPTAEYRRHLQQRFQNILNGAAMRERGEEQ